MTGAEFRQLRQAAGVALEALGRLMKPPISRQAVFDWEQSAVIPQSALVIVPYLRHRASTEGQRRTAAAARARVDAVRSMPRACYTADCVRNALPDLPYCGNCTPGASQMRRSRCHCENCHDANNAHAAALRASRKARGICYVCGKKKVGSFSLCESCRIKRRKTAESA